MTRARLSTPGSPLWPHSPHSRRAFARQLGSHDILSRCAPVALALAAHVDELTGRPNFESDARMVFLARMACHLSEAPWANADKTAQLTTQAARLFADWTTHDWTAFRESCALMRAELSTGLTPSPLYPSPRGSSPWLSDRVFVHLAAPLDFSRAPPEHALHLANLCSGFATKGRSGFGAWLAARGMPWTPELFSALVSRACARSMSLFWPATDADPLGDELRWGIRELARAGHAPTALDAAACWTGLRPSWAQLMLDAGAPMPYLGHPALDLAEAWHGIDPNSHPMEADRRAATLAHAASSWEAASLAQECAPAAPRPPAARL